MEIGEPPPDPFAGMDSEERKRAQETAILEMAYNLADFARVEPRERPDFALSRTVRATAFGVEITQIFPNESHARLNLVSGYHHRLWSGGAHLHKRDVRILQSVTVGITDKDGNVKQTGVPAIITETPRLPAFRSTLCTAICTKVAKDFDVENLAHLNLVVLDWFNLPFDATDSSTDRFFDEEMRAVLKDCSFREVLLLVASTNNHQDQGDEVDPPAHHLIPLRQLLAMERVYVTAHMVDEEYPARVRDVVHLNALVIDHVSRVQGYGVAIERDGRLFLRFGSATLEIGERGMQILDHQDLPVDGSPVVEIADRMPPDVEVRVAERANANVFRTGYAPLANRPSTWLAG